MPYAENADFAPLPSGRHYAARPRAAQRAPPIDRASQSLDKSKIFILQYGILCRAKKAAFI
jgi:hypothetical protein